MFALRVTTLTKYSGNIFEILRLIPAPLRFYQQSFGTLVNCPGLCCPGFFGPEFGVSLYMYVDARLDTFWTLSEFQVSTFIPQMIMHLQYDNASTI